jgi:hypothetical protein
MPGGCPGRLTRSTKESAWISPGEFSEFQEGSQRSGQLIPGLPMDNEVKMEC